MGCLLMTEEAGYMNNSWQRSIILYRNVGEAENRKGA
jgi:hypothetical protein